MRTLTYFSLEKRTVNLPFVFVFESMHNTSPDKVSENEDYWMENFSGKYQLAGRLDLFPHDGGYSFDFKSLFSKDWDVTYILGRNRFWFIKFDKVN